MRPQTVIGFPTARRVDARLAARRKAAAALQSCLEYALEEARRASMPQAAEMIGAALLLVGKEVEAG